MVVKTLLFLALLMTLNACDKNGSESYPIKSGTLSNACGPADEPVVRLLLTDGKIDCTTNPASTAFIATFLDFPEAQDVTAGMTLLPLTYGAPESATACEAGYADCRDIGTLYIEVVIENNATLSGKYFIEDENTTEEGRYIIERCAVQSLCL